MDLWVIFVYWYAVMTRSYSLLMSVTIGGRMDDYFIFRLLNVKVKYFMSRSLQVENLLPQNVGSIINYLQ